MSLPEEIAAVKLELADLKQQLTSQISEQKEHDIQQRIIAKENQLTELYKQNAPTDYSKYPFFRESLQKVGLSTPWEQYTLYGTVIGAILASIEPLRKAYYLDKWMNETRNDYKIIWQDKGKLRDLELKAGKLYLELLRQTPRRYGLVPITFCIIEAAKEGYKYIFKRRRSPPA